MISEVRELLRLRGYTIHESRQEKLGTGELVVILDDVSLEIETTLTYKVPCWVLIEWDSMDPDNIPLELVTLVSNLEPDMLASDTLRKATFKFIQSEVNQLGLMYRISVIFEYTEEITLA
jgi:hypothetical protein